MQTQRMIDRGARDAERQRLLGRDEWCRRFAIYIHGKTGVDNAIASQAATTRGPKKSESVMKTRHMDRPIRKTPPNPN